jgi:hypothetical protein
MAKMTCRCQPVHVRTSPAWLLLAWKLSSTAQRVPAIRSRAESVTGVGDQQR